MKKRILAIMLAITLLFSTFNFGAVVVAAEPDTDVVITVLDSNNKNITDSSLSVTVTCAYKRGFSNNIRYENISVTDFDTNDGVFGYNYSSQNNIQYYTINATLTVDGKTYTASNQVAKNADSVVITLEDYIQGDRWETFDIYYIADGHFPEVFYGYGEPEDYGPGRNDTPLLRINVNITKLRSPEYADRVLYQENVSGYVNENANQNIQNAYHFIPARIDTAADITDSGLTQAEKEQKAYENNVSYAKAFWNVVKECMDEESIKAFESTGLYNTFVLYCLKNQGSAANPDNHGDGILTVTPPVYVIEMYDHNGDIIGGFTNDKTSIENNAITVDQVLEFYNTHLNQEITWTKDQAEGVWNGYYYVTEANGRKYRYNLQLTQTNVAETSFTSKSGIKYKKMTESYYLATFKTTKETVSQVAYIVTYTDGVEDRVFNDQVTPLNAGDGVVAFNENIASTDRENYVFLGWTLEGGDGTLLSQEDILKKYTSVNKDLTFVAVYMVAPSKYTGTVEVILDGYYNSTTAVATGERVDITKIKGNNISLYVSKDKTEYIPLTCTATGVYSAELVNGTYEIYYFDGTNYVLSSNQHLSINNEDRTRYIFFEYVDYKLNGGTGGPNPLLEYYDTGAMVKVSDKVPTKQGYIFSGWKDQDGKIYASDSVLSDSIGSSYTLTATWVDAADVYVNVTINHKEGNNVGYDVSQEKDDISLDLVYTPDVSIPYVETGDRIVIDNENHPNHSYTYKLEDETNADSIIETSYKAVNPSVIGVSKENSYTVAVSKHGYEVKNVQTKFAENGDIIIDVELEFSPDNDDLEFEVRVDANVPEHLLPQAAIVKVLCWSGETNSWQIITQHRNTTNGRKPGVRVDIDTATRKGTGSYPVWVNELLDDNSVSAYGYRIIVTALIYPDGTIVETNWSNLENLKQLTTNLYTVDFGAVADGKVFGNGLNGAYFENDAQLGEFVQKGKLDAVITAAGYNVTFDAQGGTVNGMASQTVKNQYKVPSLNNYVPVRYGGYVFEGWYYKDANGNYTVLATEGVYLESDITLYAKWRNPLTVEGLITVGATYEQKNANGTVTIHKIPEHEWVNSVIVLLQKVEPNGYTDTIDQQFLFLNYKDGNYYHDGRVVGYALYSFTGIADNGSNYRIQVLINNYTATFQNEAESINDYKKYPSYNLTDYIADFGGDNVATVNAHAHFLPQEFELKYSVNAEQIGNGFKPQEVEVLVTSDGRNTGVIPSEWSVISQMVFGDIYVGDNVKITNGKGQGSDKVWVGRADGMTNYQYGLRIQDVVLANGNRVQFADSLPFTVEYKAPAYYMDNAQVGELVAILAPKTYSIKYDTNGGKLSGIYPMSHTWSYETSIEGIVPYFEGFKFDGWYYDADFTQPVGDYIDASVASDVTLYAKWIQVMDTVDLRVTIKHTSLKGGLAGNFNKTLYAQLTYADRNLAAGEQIFIDMPNHAKVYPDGQWHTHGDEVTEEVFEAPSFYTHLSAEYDYSANVLLEGYFVAEKTVEKVERPDGSILHIVNITLQYDPEVFDLHFYVEMADGVPNGAYPQSVEVKVTSWYDDPAIDTQLDWYRITQHKLTTLTVNIDSETGRGEGSYPVWHWFDEDKKIPYYYRIEIIQLNFEDGSFIPMSEDVADVSYSGGGYTGEIVVKDGEIPTLTDDENQIKTNLYGAYAAEKSHAQIGTVGAVIDINKVVFHANNNDAIGEDEFRTYYPATSKLTDGYMLNSDGTISAFYEIPEFEFYTHNNYVFKGWYLDKDTTDRPIDWSNTYDSTTHIYAHWINVGSVAKEEADDKKTYSDTYKGFDLIGVQTRTATTDSGIYYGTAGSGLRFITVLSDELYNEINAIGNGNELEYGFVLARSSTAIRNAGTTPNYTLQLKGNNINGVNTNSAYSYVQNFKCSGVQDHYNGDAYRLYTAVITYTSYTGERLEEEYNQEFAARSYIKYVDANGMERIYYNNYTGTNFYGGCSISFNGARELMSK